MYLLLNKNYIIIQYIQKKQHYGISNIYIWWFYDIIDILCRSLLYFFWIVIKNLFNYKNIGRKQKKIIIIRPYNKNIKKNEIL